jgi:hypothetical protein
VSVLAQRAGELEPVLLRMGERKQAHASFGRPEWDTKPLQSSFLLSRSRSRSAATAFPHRTPPARKHSKQQHKPPVPSRSEQPSCGLDSQKDYVRANAIENILAEPKARSSAQQALPGKHAHGKVPRYLKRVKAEAQRKTEEEAATAGSSSADDAAGRQLRKLPEAEQKELVRELKLKWERVNEAYQKLPFTLDTPQKRARKEQLERELKQLEHDVETLQHKAVLVAEGE